MTHSAVVPTRTMEVPQRSANSLGRGHHLVRGDVMVESTSTAHYRVMAAERYCELVADRYGVLLAPQNCAWFTTRDADVGGAIGLLGEAWAAFFAAQQVEYGAVYTTGYETDGFVSHSEGGTGEQNDGDDTELRAIFGEPVEGRDFTRIDGSRRGTEAAP